MLTAWEKSVDLQPPAKKQKLEEEIKIDDEIDDENCLLEQKSIITEPNNEQLVFDEDEDEDDEDEDEDDDDDDDDDDDEEFIKAIQRSALDASRPVIPIFYTYTTPLDISGACFNIIDPENVSDEDDLNFLHRYMNMCYGKENLLTFDHPGDSGMGRAQGKLSTVPSVKAEALAAINEYKKLNPNASLELQEVHSLNECYMYSRLSYLTFTAKDNNTNQINKYQAAVWDRRVLGLFRDASNDKVLAILKIKGVDYEAASDQGSADSADSDSADVGLATEK